jgi:ketosteroid isomerase-like protein
MSHANEDMLRTAYEAFAKGDVETVMSLLTDDIEYYVSGRSPVSGTYKGKDEVLGLFGKMMELSGGTFQVDVQDILANDKHGGLFRCLLLIDFRRRGE